jgi:D-alanyl-D-alanine carboxypeptidase
VQAGREIVMGSLRVISLCLSSFLLLAGPLYGEAPSRSEAIAACMLDASSALRFSGSVFVRNKDLTVERSFGTSDIEGKISNASDTRFNIGSVNKMFIAIAIGILVDRGEVRFDAPIGRYLPELKPEFAKITIDELLEHTSGLGDYFRPENRPMIDAAKTASDLLPLALSAPPAFAPGSRRAYSNSGFVVLGAIIEKLTGHIWSDFVQKEILDRAGMSDTRFDSVGGATPLSRMLSASHAGAPNAAPGPVNASPAGGMFSTPSDLSGLLGALFDGRLVSKTTLATMLTPRPDPAGGPGTTGYGLLSREVPSPRVSIGGGAPGVNADVAYFRDSGLQFIALANVDPPVAMQMNQVLEAAIMSPDTASGCKAALADPKLRNPPGILIGPGPGKVLGPPPH